MLRATRWATMGTVLLVLLTASTGTTPSLAGTPRLVASVTEPFQVGDQLVPAGTLTLRSLRDYHPGARIDELWSGTRFLGFWVADGRENESRAERDTIVFERNSAGRLVLVGYVLRGSRSDVAYRYRAASLGSDRASLPAAVATRDRVLASR